MIKKNITEKGRGASVETTETNFFLASLRGGNKTGLKKNIFLGFP